MTPDDNGKQLAINNNYTLKTKAAEGFVFNCWCGGVPMNTTSTLTFTLASNLVIIANFKDTAKPVAKISFPPVNLKWSGLNIIVTGTASDNVVGPACRGSWIQTNGSDWRGGCDVMILANIKLKDNRGRKILPLDDLEQSD